HCGTTGERERHVGTELGGQVAELLPGEPGLPEQVASEQSRSGVRGATGHAAIDRDPLGDLQVHPGAGAGGLGEQHGGAVGEVTLIIGDQVRTASSGAHRDLLGRGSQHVLVQGDRLEHRGQLVVPVLAGRADAQHQVELAGSAHVHGDLSGGPGAQRESSWSAARAAASAANWVMSSRSPLLVGSIPAARATLSARCAEPAQVASAARNVLRRWAKAASMQVNTSSREAAVVGGSRRTRRTRAESTFGTGQKMLREMVPARVTEAYQAAFAEGTP